jgi:hypothetical protein
MGGMIGYVSLLPLLLNEELGEDRIDIEQELLKMAYDDMSLSPFVLLSSYWNRWVSGCLVVLLWVLQNVRVIFSYFSRFSFFHILLRFFRLAGFSRPTISTPKKRTIIAP